MDFATPRALREKKEFSEKVCVNDDSRCTSADALLEDVLCKWNMIGEGLRMYGGRKTYQTPQRELRLWSAFRLFLERHSFHSWEDTAFMCLLHGLMASSDVSNAFFVGISSVKEGKSATNLNSVAAEMFTESIGLEPKIYICNWSYVKFKRESVSVMRDSLPTFPQICLCNRNWFFWGHDSASVIERCLPVIMLDTMVG